MAIFKWTGAPCTRSWETCESHRYIFHDLVVHSNGFYSRCFIRQNCSLMPSQNRWTPSHTPKCGSNYHHLPWLGWHTNNRHNSSKFLFNSTISTPVTSFMCCDIIKNLPCHTNVTIQVSVNIHCTDHIWDSSNIYTTCVGAIWICALQDTTWYVWPTAGRILEN